MANGVDVGSMAVTAHETRTTRSLKISKIGHWHIAQDSQHHTHFLIHTPTRPPGAKTLITRECEATDRSQDALTFNSQ